MTKKVISFCAAVVLAVPLLASIQATSQSSDQQNAQRQPSTQSQDANQNQSDQNKHSKHHNKNQKMSGNVSNDGKTFTSDQDNKNYTVDNPSVLQGQEGQHVDVIVAVDPDTGTIHIIQVAAPAPPQ